MATLFSWGYWGWGASTRQLIQAVDLVERARGFEPPIFVEIRLLREGKARGFVGNAFRDVVGASRYRWMPCLGNLGIKAADGIMRIKEPRCAACLLKFALEAEKEGRRAIFFCACEFPLDEDGNCHRREIVKLLFANAKKLGKEISIVEWPGGEPSEVTIKVDRKMFSALVHGRMSIPFNREQLKDYAGLAPGSLVTLECEDDDRTGRVLVGPAKFTTSKTKGGHWYLPVIEQADEDTSIERFRGKARAWRKSHGLNEQKSLEMTAISAGVNKRGAGFFCTCPRDGALTSSP